MRVIVICILLIGLQMMVDTSRALCVFSTEENDQLFIVHPSNEITIKKFNIEISKGHHYTGYGSVPPYLATAILLAKTEDKDKERAILNQFSVNQLLALNVFKSVECNDEKYSERNDICERIKASRADANTIRNLSDYCQTTLRVFKEEWCPAHMIYRAYHEVPFIKMKRIKTFHKDLEHYVRHAEDEHNFRFRDAIEKVLESKRGRNNQYLINLKDSCKVFCEKFEPVYKGKEVYMKFSSDDLDTLFGVCTLVGEYFMKLESSLEGKTIRRNKSCNFSIGHDLKWLKCLGQKPVLAN
jgi:hypothetical protein